MGWDVVRGFASRPSRLAIGLLMSAVREKPVAMSKSEPAEDTMAPPARRTVAG